MGVYDRDYLRDEHNTFDGRGYGNGSITQTMIAKIIIFTAAVFFLDALFFKTIPNPEGLSTWLAATPDTLRSFHWYQLLTYGILHANFGHLLMNMIGLFFLGRVIEDRFGSAEFLRIYLVGILCGGLVWTIRMHFQEGAASMVGASAGVTCIIMLFVFLFPEEKLFLLFIPVGIPAWILGVIFIGLDVARTFNPASQIAADAHLAGAGFAWFYFATGMRLGNLIPRFRRRSKEPKLKIHDPDGDPEPDLPSPDLQDEIDRILEKIGKTGTGSLTEEEDSKLKNYSEKLRKRKARTR